MRFYINIVFVVLFLGSAQIAKSQDLYENYLPQFNLDSLETGTFNLHFYNNNFIKNNEYFGPYTEGITYIGSILQPEISWALNDKFSLSAGWYFRHYYGQDGFEKSLPVVRARYLFSKGSQLIFGQLDGQLQHGFVEPIYSTDNYFAKNPEYGIQLIIDRKKLHTDMYLDWEKFLLPGEAHQEVITGGLLASYYLNGKSNNSGLSAHFQNIIHHFGGQVDNSDNPLQSRANIAVGLKYAYLPGSKLLTRLTFSSLYMQAMELSQTNTIPFESGFAIQNTVTLENDLAKLSTGWFHGEYFFSPMGDYLFQSVSQLNNWYIGEKRDLITSKLFLGHQITKGVSFGFRLESYYELQSKSIDFSYGLNVSVNATVFEKKVK